MIRLQSIKQNLRNGFCYNRKHVSASMYRCSTHTVLDKKTPANVVNNKLESWETAMPYSSIPGPKPLPLIGNAWLFLPIIGTFYKASILDMYTQLYEKYGKILRIGAIPAPDMVFISDPSDIETVFRNEGIYPIREGTGRTLGYYRKHVRSDVFQGVGGMLTVQGKEWYDVRSKVNPILMQPQTMFQYIEGIDVITNALLDRIRHFAKSNHNNEMPDDFIITIYSWTLESVAHVALDKRLGCLDPTLENTEPLKIIQNVIKAFELYEKLEFQPSFRNIYKTKQWKHFVEVIDFLTFTYLKHIEEAESQPPQVKEKNMSILQQLLRVDRKVAIATALDLLTAGIDTTGKQTASILYYLAKNQGVQDLLRKELTSLLPDKHMPLTKEVLGKASYLKAVIKETLRLAPIATGTMRQSVKDLVLSGYRIPKGTNIISLNGLSSRLAENYPRPLEFLPERWLRTTEGDLSPKNVNPFVTLPFGFGPRSCVGKRIASLEMEIGIAKIIRNFRVMWHHKEPTFNGAPFVGIVDPLKFQFNEIDS